LGLFSLALEKIGELASGPLAERWVTREMKEKNELETRKNVYSGFGSTLIFC